MHLCMNYGTWQLIWWNSKEKIIILRLRTVVTRYESRIKYWQGFSLPVTGSDRPLPMCLARWRYDALHRTGYRKYSQPLIPGIWPLSVWQRKGGGAAPQNSSQKILKLCQNVCILHAFGVQFTITLHEVAKPTIIKICCELIIPTLQNVRGLSPHSEVRTDLPILLAQMFVKPRYKLWNRFLLANLWSLRGSLCAVRHVASRSPMWSDTASSWLKNPLTCSRTSWQLGSPVRLWVSALVSPFAVCIFSAKAGQWASC